MLQVEMVLDLTKLKTEIAAIKSTRRYKANKMAQRASEAHMYMNNDRLSALLEWCQVICFVYGIEVSCTI